VKGLDAERHGAKLLALLVLAPLLVLIDAAVSIDAPVFVAIARHILEAPADPFGFQMVWDPTSPAVARFNRNPPLLSYWLALWIGLFGEREPVMHAALLPFPLLAALAFRGLAKRLAPGRGEGPALLLVATPAFGVLASTLMLDVPLLAFWLLGLLALVRGAASERLGWPLLAGLAAAAAGLTKYIGFATAPLLAAGVVLLYRRRRGPALLAVLAPPLLLWAAWGAYTSSRYGFVHFFGSTDVVFDRDTDPREVWNQIASLPIYLGHGLLFPIFRAAGSFARGARGGAVALACLLVGTAAVALLLPVGEPSRRVPLGVDQAVLAAFGFAGGAWLALRCLARARPAAAAPEDRFLALWLAGLLVFSALLNWHVNAADALLAAPPLLLLLFRDAELCPSRRALGVWLAVMFPLAWLLAAADAEQGGVYRTAARRIAGEIGAQPGARWFVGHWGLQHYLEREGFSSVLPPMYGRSDLAQGDWVATARNVSQLDVSRDMSRYRLGEAFSWNFEAKLPLRTTNADAGSGFYSHHAGYVPFAFSLQPLDRVQLGRVEKVRGPTRAAPR
jgi:4-amino-4-deoxy-L-arabinose transferase-like glycosyltransferase